MKPAVTTEEALHYLAEGRVGHVCLIKPGHFAIIVTFDPRAQDFIFGEPRCLGQPLLTRRTRVKMAEILFQTQPAFFLSSSAA